MGYLTDQSRDPFKVFRFHLKEDYGNRSVHGWGEHPPRAEPKKTLNKPRLAGTLAPPAATQLLPLSPVDVADSKERLRRR